MNTGQAPVTPASAVAPAPAPIVRHCLKCMQPIQPGDNYRTIPAVAFYEYGTGPGYVAFIHDDCGPARRAVR